MKILVDDTNPENGDGKYYFTLYEVPDGTKVEDYAKVGPLKYIWVDEVFEYPVLTEFIVDLNVNLEQVVKRLDPVFREYFGTDEDDDPLLLGISQLSYELVKAFGCEGLHYAYC